MASFKALTVPQQIATHLRSEIMRGRWGSNMPGRSSLATELGFSTKSVNEALSILQAEGLLEPRGIGKSMRINRPQNSKRKGMSVAILCFDISDGGNRHLFELRHHLEQLNFTPFFTRKSLSDLKMSVKRVKKLVAETPADAWIVSAASQEVLEYFASQEKPAFAISGRLRHVAIAGGGLEKPSVAAEVARHLISLGHQRISCLFRAPLRLPNPGSTPTAILNELQLAGLPNGSFNLPDWEDSNEGFSNVLNSLFGTTPPTALIIDQPFLFHAAYHHISRMGLRIPKDVSMVCTDPDPGFAWCSPSVSHLSWDYNLLIKQIVEWLQKVAIHENDISQSFQRVKFIKGETIAPPSTIPSMRLR